MEKGSANQYYRDELSKKFDLIDTSAFEKIGDKYSDIKITHHTTPSSEKFVIYFPEKKGMAVERRVTYEYVYDPIKPEKGNWVIHHQRNTALRDNFGKIAYTDDISKVLKHFRQTASAARSLKKTIEKEQMNERKLTKAELDKREDIIKDMKGNKRSLVKRYGKDAEKVMYGRATNMAKKKTDENMDQKAKIREMIKAALSTPITEKTSEDDNDRRIYMGKDNYKRDPKWADYAVIGQYSIDKRYWDQFSEYHSYLRGKQLTNMKFDGDVTKAYDAIVKPIKLEETVTENVDQKLVNKVSRFITSLANYYDYSEQDAVYAIMQALRAHNANFQGLNEDIDLGHEDDEPGMLKSDLYRIGKYAMELYQIMDKLDDGQEVDLPHWWQAKVIKAKDALVSAKHFLDFELKEPQIDQVTDMVDAKGKKYAIDEGYMGNEGDEVMITMTKKPDGDFPGNWVLEKPDGSAMVDMFFDSKEEAKKYASKKGLIIVNGLRQDIQEKIAEIIKGAHSVMGGKAKKKKRPSNREEKLAKDAQADYEKSKKPTTDISDEEEEFDWETYAAGNTNDRNSLEETTSTIAEKLAKQLKSTVSEVKIDYDFSEEELKRVIKQLKRGASTEVKMIKAFEKALGRELTADELREIKETKNTIGLAFKDEDEYKDFKEFAEDNGAKIYKDGGWDSKTKSWYIEIEENQLAHIYGDIQPGNNESGWMAIKDDFESVIISEGEDKEWNTSEQKMVKQIERALKDGDPIYNLPTKTQNFYYKHKDKFTK